MNSAARRSPSCTRQRVRYQVLQAGQVFLEIDDGAGGLHRFDVLDLGPRGVGFGLEAEHPPMACGQALDPVVLCIRGTRVQGRLTIVHVTEAAFSGTKCGGYFEPASETEARRLAFALERIGAWRRGD